MKAFWVGLGYSDLGMTMVYAHMAPEHLRSCSFEPVEYVRASASKTQIQARGMVVAVRWKNAVAQGLG